MDIVVITFVERIYKKNRKPNMHYVIVRLSYPGPQMQLPCSYQTFIGTATYIRLVADGRMRQRR